MQESYPNIKEFKIIVYPINKLNYFLSNLLEQENKSKFNSSGKGNEDYKDILKRTNIINSIYKKDKILFKKLVSSKEYFLEFSFDSFIEIG